MFRSMTRIAAHPLLSGNANRQNMLSTVSLNQELGEVNSRVFSPVPTKLKSFSRISRVKPIRRFYNVRSPNINNNENKKLKVINLQSRDQSECVGPMSPQSATYLPKINKLRMMKARLNQSLSSSRDELANTTLKELADSIPVDAPVPLFKNQYSIGHKYIPHQKRGRAGILKKFYETQKY